MPADPIAQLGKSGETSAGRFEIAIIYREPEYAKARGIKEVDYRALYVVRAASAAEAQERALAEFKAAAALATVGCIREVRRVECRDPRPNHTDLELFLELHWSCWRKDGRYLGIGPPFLSSCPPMWFIGGRHVPGTGRPLVLLSLEPLVAEHYERQVSFASGGVEAYMRWQLDYFDVFPTPALAGPAPQTYWRTMFHLVAGFSGASGSFDWRAFRGSYVELPLVPLHAPKHRTGAFRRAARVVESLLHERLRLIATRWPSAVFFAAGKDVAKALPPAAGTHDEVLVLPDWVQERRARFGDALFDRHILRRSVDVGAGQNISVFVRGSPFSSGHQPSNEGLRALGRVLRELDSPPDTARDGV